MHVDNSNRFQPFTVIDIQMHRQTKINSPNIATFNFIYPRNIFAVTITSFESFELKKEEKKTLTFMVSI